MATLPTTTPGNRNNTFSSVETTVVGTEPVLQAIASANDASYMADTSKVTHTGIGAFALGDMPADFATMESSTSLSVQLRYANSGTLTLNTWDSLTAQIYRADGTTALTNAVTVASAITTTTPTNSSVVNFTGVNTTADKTVWDGALLFIRIAITKNKGGDAGVDQRVHAGELTGTYTPAVTAAFQQTAFRGRNDDGSESAATWKAAENTNFNQALDATFRLRVAISETAGGAASPTQVLRYSLNGGAYTAVANTATAVNHAASSNVDDAQATTDQIGGTGTFRAGQVNETSVDPTGPVTASLQGNDHTEHEFVLKLASASISVNDTVAFRVYDSGGTALSSYTQTPTVTATAAAASVGAVIAPRPPLGALVQL